MISNKKSRNKLLSLIYYVIFIAADKASETNHYPSKDPSETNHYPSKDPSETNHYPRKSPYCSLDDMTEILNHKFIARDSSEYSINFDGPLNPLFGYLYRNSNLLASKRFFSHGIKLKSSCDCLKNNDLKEDSANNSLNKEDCICTSHRLFPPEYDTAFELYEGQKVKRDKPELDYLYDYHNCLIDMFKSFDRRKIVRFLKDSFSYFMETLPAETAERFLAVLFLLPENIYSIINSSVDCAGQDHPKNGLYYCGAENTADERVVFHSGAFEFEMRCNSVKYGELIVRNSIKSIIGFFSDCGTKYKEIAEGKREASREHGNDTIYFIETPEFLIQNYIYEYCKNKRDKHIRIVKNIFRLLNEAETGNDKLIRKYFTQIGSEDEDAMKNRHHVEIAVSSYKKEFHKILGVYNALPLNFLKKTPKILLFEGYNRGLDNAVYNGERGMSCAETAVFCIMCILFYDSKGQCFKLPDGVELRDRRLQKLFSNQAFVSSPYSSGDRTTSNYGRTNGTYDSNREGHAELSMNDLNKIFGDLQDQNILYNRPRTSRETGITVRDESLVTELFNVVYVIAYMTRKEEIMRRIVEARKREAENEAINLEIRQVITRDLFLSLAHNKDMKIEIFQKYNKIYDVMLGPFMIMKYEVGNNLEVIVEIDFGTEARIKIDCPQESSLTKPLDELKEKLKSTKNKPVLLDLLHRTIEYDFNARFRSKITIIMNVLNYKLEEIAGKGSKARSIEHLFTILDLFSHTPYVDYQCCLIYRFIDEMRHLILDCELDQVEISKVSNLLANAVLYGWDLLKGYHITYRKRHIRSLFMAIYGIRTKEISMLKSCRNTGIVERETILFSYGDEYEMLRNATYYLNWYLIENCSYRIDRFYEAVLTRYQSMNTIGSNHRYTIYGNSCEDEIERFYMDLYYKMKGSDDKKHIDMFVEEFPSEFPSDPSALVALFFECLTNTGYLNTKIHEVVSRFLKNKKIVHHRAPALGPFKIDQRYIDFTAFQDVSSWERLLSLTRERSEDIDKVWEMCDYVLKNNYLTKSSAIALRDKYEKLRNEINRSSIVE